MINKLEQVHIQSSVAGSKIVLHTPKTQYAAGFLTFKKKKTISSKYNDLFESLTTCNLNIP
jgi:hypothetical protein